MAETKDLGRVVGQNGENGVGVPVGGSTGQVLAKKSATDYDTEWVDNEGGSEGGSSDITWEDVKDVLPDGKLYQYLGFKSSSDVTNETPRFDYPIRASWSISSNAQLSDYTYTDDTHRYHDLTRTSSEVDGGIYRINVSSSYIRFYGRGQTNTVIVTRIYEEYNAEYDYWMQTTQEVISEDETTTDTNANIYFRLPSSQSIYVYDSQNFTGGNLSNFQKSADGQTLTLFYGEYAINIPLNGGGSSDDSVKISTGLREESEDSQYYEIDETHRFYNHTDRYYGLSDEEATQLALIGGVTGNLIMSTGSIILYVENKYQMLCERITQIFEEYNGTEWVETERNTTESFNTIGTYTGNVPIYDYNHASNTLQYGLEFDNTGYVTNLHTFLHTLGNIGGGELKPLRQIIVSTGTNTITFYYEDETSQSYTIPSGGGSSSNTTTLSTLLGLSTNGVLTKNHIDTINNSLYAKTYEEVIQDIPLYINQYALGNVLLTESQYKIGQGYNGYVNTNTLFYRDTGSDILTRLYNFKASRIQYGSGTNDWYIQYEFDIDSDFTTMPASTRDIRCHIKFKYDPKHSYVSGYRDLEFSGELQFMMYSSLLTDYAIILCNITTYSSSSSRIPYHLYVKNIEICTSTSEIIMAYGNTFNMAYTGRDGSIDLDEGLLMYSNPFYNLRNHKFLVEMYGYTTNDTPNDLALKCRLSFVQVSSISTEYGINIISVESTSASSRLMRGNVVLPIV